MPQLFSIQSSTAHLFLRTLTHSLTSLHYFHETHNEISVDREFSLICMFIDEKHPQRSYQSSLWLFKQSRGEKRA